MITAIVEFNLPSPFTLDQARQTFKSTAPKYRGMRGLVRKYYFVSGDGMKAGGIYLWESRAAADAVYTEDWKDFVRGKYGSEPNLVFLNCPVIVDNASDEILVDASDS